MEALDYLIDAQEYIKEMDYLGTTPEPMPPLKDLELLDLIKDFWAQGQDVASTYAWLIMAKQNTNPFEIKMIFDQMDRELEDHQRRVEEWQEHDLD